MTHAPLSTATVLTRLRGLADSARALASDVASATGRRRYRMRGALRGVVDVDARFTGAPARVEEASQFLFGRLVDVREEHEATDAVDVELDETWSFASSSPEGTRLAQPWLRALARPGPDVDGYFERHLGKTLLRALRKGKERLRRRTTDDVDAFYEELLLPTIRARHGDGALIPPLAYLKSWNGRTTKLAIELVVDEADRPVGGAAVVEHAGEPMYTILASGVRVDALDDRGLKQEAKALLYEDVFRRAAARGADVDLGLTRPFADDGVLAYKRRWGALLHPAPYVTKYVVRVAPTRADEIEAAWKLLCVADDAVSLQPAPPS